MSKSYAWLVVLLLIPSFVLGAVFGSKSLLHVQKASTLKPGRLELRSDMRFFSKVGDYLGQNKPADFTAVNYWLVQGNALLSFGVMNNFDITLMTRVYQDTHKKNEYNSPDDIFLDIKGGSFGFMNDRIQVGGILSFRFPTGEVHNYPFEPYTAGALEFGLTGLFSYYKDPFLPDRDISIHANLGWYNHNDAGKILYQQTNPQGEVIREFRAGNNATALRFGLGFSYPTEMFDINLELWGNNFISKPDSMAYSRENYVYVTPSVRFKPRWWLNFDLALDVRVSPDKDESSFALPGPVRNLTLPNYPSWRMTLGMGFVLNQGAERARRAVGGGATIREKVDFFEKLLKEKEKARSIEEELKRLRREREQAEKELEELRQLLEEQGK